MGGKRPDQYRIDPREGRATDHKSMPLDHKMGERDTELYGRVMKGRVKKAQPTPSEAPSPEAEQAHQDEVERVEHVHEEEERLRARRRHMGT